MTNIMCDKFDLRSKTPGVEYDMGEWDECTKNNIRSSGHYYGIRMHIHKGREIIPTGKPGPQLVSSRILMTILPKKQEAK